MGLVVGLDLGIVLIMGLNFGMGLDICMFLVLFGYEFELEYRV